MLIAEFLKSAQKPATFLSTNQDCAQNFRNAQFVKFVLTFSSKLDNLRQKMQNAKTRSFVLNFYSQIFLV